MSDTTTNGDRLDDLHQRATLQEYIFTSDAPGVGRIIARLRDAWNGVATRWQVRPLMEQQSAFNQALASWLAHPPSLDAQIIEQDRMTTHLSQATGLLEARMGYKAKQRLRIAYFSPLPPSRSGIADYSAELLPYLSEWADITVFADDPEIARVAGLPAQPLGEFPETRHAYDLPLYQMGNSDQHEEMYDLLVRFPGVVVLHDYFLHHFIRHHTAGRGDWMSYSREMAYSMGSDGRQLARAIRQGQAVAPLFDVPLNRRLIDASLGLIVHSQYAANGVRRQRTNLPLAVVPALVDVRSGYSLRPRLNLPDDAVLFGAFGQITAEKRIDLALRAFRRVRSNYPDARFLLVGEALPDIDLQRLLEELDLRDSVHHIGHVPTLDEFVNWIYTVDVVINLRQPTVGETSAIAVRAMAASRPLIVFDHGWYSELPDATAMKASPGDVDGLVSAMERLAASSEERRTMGLAGLDYVRQFCLPQHIARAYVEFLESVLEPRGNV